METDETEQLQQVKRFQARLPLDLVEEVQREAEKDTRSFNGQLIALLREALAARRERS